MTDTLPDASALSQETECSASINEPCDFAWFLEIVHQVSIHTVEDDLIAAVLSKLREIEVAAEVVVRRLSPDGTELVPFDPDTGSDERQIRLRTAVIPITGSYEGHALELDRLLVVNDDKAPDIRLERNYIDIVRAVRGDGVREAYFYPMTGHDQIGTVTFYGFKDLPFDEERHELTHRTARVLASGIEKCRLIAAAESRRAELDLASAQLQSSNRDLHDFAYVASHDLQEPLRKIQTFGGRLESRAAERLSEDQLQHLERMTSASQKMQALINDLLRFSRANRGNGPKRVLPLCDLLGVAIDSKTSEHGLDGFEIHSPTLPLALVDRAQFISVFETLIENAWTYRSEGDDVSTLTVAAEVTESSVSISFTDNGIGFDNKYADRIFQPFFRLHGHDEYEGSGIGLAICARVLEQHGGSITAHSEEGVGSTFTMTMPIATSEPSTGPNGKPLAPTDPSGGSR